MLPAWTDEDSLRSQKERREWAAVPAMTGGRRKDRGLPHEWHGIQQPQAAEEWQRSPGAALGCTSEAPAFPSLLVTLESSVGTRKRSKSSMLFSPANSKSEEVVVLLLIFVGENKSCKPASLADKPVHTIERPGGLQNTD